MQANNTQADVMIIGAGPAGTASAIELNRFGFSVVLVDKVLFPRPQIGQSLPPSIFPLLEHLGVKDVVHQAKFEKTNQVKVTWAGTRFNRNMPSGMEGINVDRCLFDHLLLNAAYESGTEIHLGFKVAKPVWQSGSERWEVYISNHAEKHYMNPRFIVDASGRQGFNNNRKLRQSSPLLALYAYWNLPKHVSFSGSFIETSSDDWRWCCKLKDNLAVAAVFVDPSLTKIKGKSLLRSNYMQRLAGNDFAELLANCSLKGQVMACNATVMKSACPIIAGMIRVGDACLAQDPLSSQGVQAAIAMALQASAVVNTSLKYPARHAIAAQFYLNRLQEKVQMHLMQIEKHYLKAYQYYRTPFWFNRASISTINNTSVSKSPVHLISPDDYLKLTMDAKAVNSQTIRNGVIQEQLAL